jgi:hypothetical protein
MGDLSRRVHTVTAGVLAVVLVGLLSLLTSGPAASTTRRAAPPVAKFTVSSFNVLGASHTPPGSSREVGTTRIVYAKQLLDQRHVDVVGFQEMQAVQLTKFMAITNGSWAVYPGFELRGKDTENSIGWRTSKFELVDATTVTIPYFNGSERLMPVVLLRHKVTGLLSYVANFHNPADTATFRNQGKWRAEATRIEVALQNQLAATGIPRFMTGDMNERAPYFCRVTKEAPVKAARGGYWRDGVCYALRPRAVDWIFGSKALTFSNYLEDRSDLVKKATDHPLIVSDVAVDRATWTRATPLVPPAPLVPAVQYKKAS